MSALQPVLGCRDEVDTHERNFRKVPPPPLTGRIASTVDCRRLRQKEGWASIEVPLENLWTNLGGMLPEGHASVLASAIRFLRPKTRKSPASTGLFESCGPLPWISSGNGQA